MDPRITAKEIRKILIELNLALFHALLEQEYDKDRLVELLENELPDLLAGLAQWIKRGGTI